MRLLFDLSTLVRWRGSKVGMIRAQQELARYARKCRSDVVFTVFDPYRNRPRAIRPEWIDLAIENEASIDPSLVWDPGSEKHRLLHHLPQRFGQAFVWTTRFRRKLISELERGMLRSPNAHPWRERLLRELLKDRERSLYLKDDNTLRPCPPLDALLDDSLQISPGDIFVSAQSDWYHINLDKIISEQHRGLRRVLLCYDIIPILFPQWYTPRDAALFERYYARAFATADRVIFNARSSERDARNYCRSMGFDLVDTRVVPLGSDFWVPLDHSGSLPAELVAGRYAVYVSTIEPRKNHRLLVEVWSRLIADGVPRESFKLVFVGRRGWMMESFFEELGSNPEFGRSIIHLDGVHDQAIKTLYANAAFSLYPSLYEGYGLPPIESMLAGTPVLASAGGAIPEVVGGSGLCLDPNDPDAWYGAIRRMIEDDAYRQMWADRARRYEQITWQACAESFFASAAAPFATRAAFFQRPRSDAAASM